jgi:hypothetical protein
MNRRGLLSSILATGMAPAIGHAGILMPVRKIITPAPLSLGVDWGAGDQLAGMLRYTDRLTASDVEDVVQEARRRGRMLTGREVEISHLPPRDLNRIDQLGQYGYVMWREVSR